MPSMERAPSRELSELAWFQRNLDAGVSVIHLDDKRLIAGDWDGGIHCWDLEGENLWQAKTSNRVSSMALGGDNLFAVCGRDIVCIDISSGDIRWNVELEGSSDLVACTPDGSTILSTSSIFDLEMNDFLESTFWRFNAEGDFLRQDSIDERPWSIEMRSDGVAFLPLGRPRCGMIRATENFKLGVAAATGGIFLVYMLSMVLGFFGINIPFIHDSGPIGIGVSLFVVVVLCLLARSYVSRVRACLLACPYV